MPFTPFHFGPGLAIKAVEPRRFWLTSFMLANVLIDCEVLYYLSLRQRPLHRYLHTYIGGFSIGLLSGVMMYFVVEQAIRWRRSHMIGMSTDPPQPIVSANDTQGTTIDSRRQRRRLLESIAAGILGGVSHILLDSFMHRDMHPYWPFAAGNGLVGTMDLGTLHITLAASGFLGVVFWILLMDWDDSSNRDL